MINFELPESGSLELHHVDVALCEEESRHINGRWQLNLLRETPPSCRETALVASLVMCFEDNFKSRCFCQETLQCFMVEFLWPFECL